MNEHTTLLTMTRRQAIDRIYLAQLGVIPREEMESLKERIKIDHLYDETYVSNEELENVLARLLNVSITISES